MPDNDEARFKRRYFIIFFLICSILISCFMLQKEYVPNLLPQHKAVVKQTQHEDEEPTSELIKLDGNLDDVLKFEEDREGATVTEKPDMVTFRGINYYLFDDDILTPMKVSDWYQMDIKSSDKYDKIAEYYLSEETKDDWSEKVTLHHVKNHNNCFEFTEKLINGVIVNVETHMKMKNKELTAKNLSFNYVKKDADNSIFFWGITDVDGTDDEIQFVRCFIAPYSGKMYVVTYSLKAPLSVLDNDHIAMYINNISSAMELKKKKKDGE